MNHAPYPYLLLLLTIAASGCCCFPSPKQSAEAPTPSTSPDAGVSTASDERETIVRVKAFSPLFSPASGDAAAATWDTEAEGAAPDLWVRVSVNRESADSHGENSDTAELTVRTGMTPATKVSVNVNDSDGAFSNPTIGASDALRCNFDEAPCWFTLGSAVVQVVPGSLAPTATRAAFEVEASKRFLDGHLAELPTLCVSASPECAAAMTGLAAYPEYRELARTAATTAVNAGLNERVAAVELACSEARPECADLAKTLVQGISGSAGTTFAPEVALSTFAARASEARVKRVEAACKTPDAGCREAARSAMDFLTPETFGGAGGFDVEPYGRRVRTAATAAYVAELGEVATKGSWLALDDGSIKVAGASTTKAYANKRQDGEFPESKLTPSGYFVLVDLSLKNTTDSLQTWGKSGVPVGDEARLVDPFGTSVDRDTDLESYISHNSGATRGFEELYFDVRSGSSASSKAGFDVPSTVAKQDLYLQIEGTDPEGEKVVKLFKLF